MASLIAGGPVMDVRKQSMLDVQYEISMTDYRALAEFRYRIRRFLRFSEQPARAAGLAPQHHQLLLAIKGLPEGRNATISELAERLQLQHHSTVDQLDRLMERGFVQRHRDDDDQRREGGSGYPAQTGACPLHPH